MAKQRFINTKFWSDPWIRQKLNPLDRYLFMYFLTNEHTNICGIYELPIETIAFETGIDKQDLVKTMLPRLKPKLFYIDGWVCIVNFARHQRSRGNPKIAAGIDNALSEVPSHILDKMAQKTNSLSRSIKEYIDSDSDSDLDTDIDSDSIATQNVADKIDPKLVVSLIDAFRSVNPSASKWFANTTQRAASSRLIETHGIDKVLRVVKIIPQTNRIRYLPTITTPLQLEDKWAQLESGLLKIRDKPTTGRGLA